MATLFGRDRSVVTKHIKNVFVEKELDEETNMQIIHTAFLDKPVKYYNLDVIIQFIIRASLSPLRPLCFPG